MVEKYNKEIYIDLINDFFKDSEEEKISVKEFVKFFEKRERIGQEEYKMIK